MWLPVAAAGSAWLEVAVTGVEVGSGQVVIAVFATDDSFDRRQDPVVFAFLPADASVAVWETELPEPGEYAVAVYQDRNGNGVLDTGLIGRPTEPWGFSNNPRGLLGPPDFWDAAIEVKTASTQIRIDLN